MATELATGYVSLVPSAKGFSAAASAQLAGPLAATGASSGGAAAAGFFTKFAAVAAVAAPAAALAIGATLFKVGSSFDEAFDTIRIGTGATGDALEALKNDFKETLKGVPDDFGSVGTAIADLNTRLGLTGEPLQAMATQMLNLSRITDTDLGANIETTTRLLGDWGVASEDAADALDRVFRASQATGPSVDTLGRLMTQFGGPMRQLGFSFDETAALLGKFEKEGVNTELVMGSMRVALGKMAREGEAPVETLQRTMEAIKGAGDAGTANAMALELFGARAGPDMAAAIREGRFEVGELVDQIANGTDTIDGAAADTESFGEKWGKIKNQVLVGLEPLATRVFDAVGDAMDWISSEVMPNLEAGFAVIGAWWADNGPGIMAVVSDLADRFRTGFGLVVDFMQTNWPTVQSAIRTFVDFIQTKVLPIVKDVAGKITTAFGNVTAWFDTNWPKIQAVVEQVLGAIQLVWRAVGDDIMAIVERVFGVVQNVIGSVMKVVQGIIETVMSIITGDWSGAWNGIKRILAGVWDTIKSVVSGAVSVIKSVLGGIASILMELLRAPFEGARNFVGEAIDKIIGFVKGLPGKIKDGLSGLKDLMLKPFKLAFNAIASLWNSSIGSLSFEAPSWVPGLGGKGFSMPQIPVMHNGGVVPGLPGEELLVLLEAGERVTPAGASAAGGVIVNHNYEGIPADRAVEMAVARQRRDLAAVLGSSMVAA